MKKVLAIILFLSLPVMADTAKDSPKEHQQKWQAIVQQNLLYLELKNGTVTIQLADFFAPRHVAYIRDLVKEGFYNGLPLYRVIENFVVQGGDPHETHKSKVKKTMKAEFERIIDKKAPFTLVQQGDLLAEQTGFIDGFAVGRSIKENKEWLIHCPGVINLARGNHPDSGTTDFAIMFGPSPRHLDRNMSAFGRIIDGWDAFYKVQRNPNSPESADKIIRAYLGSSLAKEKQQTILVEDTNSPHFVNKVAQRRLYKNEFFHYKGNGNLDVCYLRPQVRVED